VKFIDQSLDGEANDGAVGDVDSSHDACCSACPQRLIGLVVDVVLGRP